MGNKNDRNKIDRKEALIQYMIDMEIQKYKYKYEYTPEQLHDILLLARTLIKTTYQQQSREDEEISLSIIITYFLESLMALKSDKITDYYKEKLKNITISRDSSLDFNDGRADFSYCFNGENKYEILLPSGKLTFDNEMTYAHEMGHIPELDLPRDSYLEYQEVIPIFMEYLILLRKYGSLNAKDCFIKERIPMDIEHAHNIKYFYKDCNSTLGVPRLYAQQELIDSYKYLESTEFVLNLIDIMSKDKKKVRSELEDYIDGKSLIDTSIDLGIDTSGCKKLLKEYQSIGKRY